MKKYGKILITFLVLSFVFASCAQATEPEVFDLAYDGETGAADLNGVELVYRMNLDSGNGVDSTDNYLGYTYNTEFADLAMARVKEAEEKLHFTLEVTSEGNASSFQLQAASGNADCDIYLGPSFNMFSWSKAGYLVGFATLSDYIDYKDAEKWGSPQILESAFYKDDIYGLTPAAWPEQNYTSFGYPLVANIDLIRQNGANEPRDLVEQGKWKWEDFHKELVANTIVEGSETKTFGMVTSYPYFAQMIILSNGVKFAMTDNNGEYYCGYYTPEGLRAIEEVRNIWNGEYADTVSRKETYLSEVVMRNFVEGEGAYAFLPTHFLFGVYGEVAMNLDNFAILPTPTGPDVDPDFVAGVYHTMYYNISIPTFSNHIDAAAMAINEIYEPLPGFETVDAIKEYMTRNYFFDERDADTFFKLFQNSCYNYDYTTGFSSRKIPENICLTTKATSELLEENESIIDGLFQDYVIPCLEVYDVLY